MDIHEDFLERREGFSTVGYIPPNGKSGVTIARGIDLGARNPDEILAWPVLDSVRQRLALFAGLHGIEAREMLTRYPLNLSVDDAQTIDKVIFLEDATRLQKRYDAATTHGSFEALPWQMQTVMMSVAYQYGNLARDTPKFWQLCCDQDWTGVVTELEHFDDAYAPRHQLEANLIKLYRSTGNE